MHGTGNSGQKDFSRHQADAADCTRRDGLGYFPGPKMNCPKCQHENPADAKFCEACATPLARLCANCSSPVSAVAQYCSQCGHALNPVTKSARYSSPRNYTPQHLVDKILTTRAALEGE